MVPPLPPPVLEGARLLALVLEREIDLWGTIFVSKKMKQKFATGKWMGRLPFGYELDTNGHLSELKKEALNVREIFYLYVWEPGFLL